MKRSQWFLVLGAVGILAVSGCGGSETPHSIIAEPLQPTAVPVTPKVTPRITPRPTVTPSPCPIPNKYHEDC